MAIKKYFFILVFFSNCLFANYQITVAHSTTVVPSATYTSTDTTGEYYSYTYSHDGCHLEFGSLTDAMDTSENQNSANQLASVDISANNLSTISQRMGVMEAFISLILLSIIDDITSVYNSQLTADSDSSNDIFVSNIEVSTPFRNQKLNTLNVGNSAILTFSNSEMHNLGIQFLLTIKIELIFDGSQLYLLYARWTNTPSNGGSKQTIVDTFFNSFSTNYLQDPFGDSDGDSLNNYNETFMYRTNPYSADSDSDGISDNIEINIRTNHNLKNSIVDNLDNLGLIDLGSLTEITANSKIIDVSGGQATVQLQMEESTDLETWTEIGDKAIMTIPADTDTKFFRFRMAD